jgi:hypothetical protein
MGISVRDLLRRKGTPYDELGLDNPALSDDPNRRHDGASNPDQPAHRRHPAGCGTLPSVEAVLDILPSRSEALSSKKTARRSSMNPASGSSDAGASIFVVTLVLSSGSLGGWASAGAQWQVPPWPWRLV